MHPWENCARVFLIRVNISDWIPAYHYSNLVKPADLTREILYIYSLVPQKVNRVSVGLFYNAYNSTSDFTSNFRWDQFPYKKSYEIFNCKNHNFGDISTLNLTQISVLWKLRLKDQMLEFRTDSNSMHSFPATNCGSVNNGKVTTIITKMKIIRFLGYTWSNSPLLYGYGSTVNTGRSTIVPPQVDRNARRIN